MVCIWYFKVCDVYAESTQKRGQYWPLNWKHAATVERQCASICCVTVALDILQTPLVLQPCKEKGGQQVAHKPQLHFTPEKLYAIVSTFFFFFFPLFETKVCDLRLNFEIFIKTFHSSLRKRSFQRLTTGRIGNAEVNTVRCHSPTYHQ